MNKKDVAQKMVQHTFYDKKLKKIVRTMVPQSKEHTSQVRDISSHMAKYKEPSESEKREFQHHTRRAYNE